MKKIYFLLLPTLFLANCKNPDVKNNSTEINSQTVETAIYKIDSYDKIVNSSIVNIEISDDVPSDEIHLISTKENLELVKYKVSDNTLTLSHTQTTITVGVHDTKIIAKVNSNKIKSFRIEGAGYITSSIIQKANDIETNIAGAGNLELNINNNSIHNKIEGLGNVKLKGRTDTATTEIDGAGNLNAFDLETNNTIVSIEGVGNADVTVSEKLNVTISGIGNLTYKGNPKEVNKKHDGLGTIKAY